jgi:hypothetical protein
MGPKYFGELTASDLNRHFAAQVLRHMFAKLKIFIIKAHTGF